MLSVCLPNIYIIYLILYTVLVNILQCVRLHIKEKILLYADLSLIPIFNTCMLEYILLHLMPTQTMLVPNGEIPSSYLFISTFKA